MGCQSITVLLLNNMNLELTGALRATETYDYSVKIVCRMTSIMKK